MSEPAPEPTLAQLTARVDELIVGIKWAFGLAIILFSLPNIYQSQIVHVYQQIFQDALPGKPLPELTVSVIYGQRFLQLLAIVWPILGMLNLVYGKRPRNWIIGSAILLFLIGLQFWVMQVALISPMVNLITGMSETP